MHSLTLVLFSLSFTIPSCNVKMVPPQIFAHALFTILHMTFVHIMDGHNYMVKKTKIQMKLGEKEQDYFLEDVISRNKLRFNLKLFKAQTSMLKLGDKIFGILLLAFIGLSFWI